MNNREKRIFENLKINFNPEFIELKNESHTHNVPENSETHFQLLMVSLKFNDQSPIDRQRMVQSVLAEEFKTGLHALSMKLLTPVEWEPIKDQYVMVSPPCFGGSLMDKK